MQEKSNRLWLPLMALAIAFAVLQLSGCAGMSLEEAHPQTDQPAPETLPETRSSHRSRPPVQVESYPQPVIPVHTRAQPSKAARVLSDRAQQQMASGEWVAAAASLERALRIEPRNPRLWNQLAHVRKVQGKDAQAANLAARSNALPGVDEQLRADNRLLMRN